MKSIFRQNRRPAQSNQARSVASSSFLNNECCIHIILLCPSPKLPKACFSFSATSIRRPHGPLLQARPRVTSHSHQAQQNCLKSWHKYPTAWWGSKPRPSIPWEMGIHPPGTSAFRPSRLRTSFLTTRLILPNSPRLFQQPPPACLPLSYHTRLFAHGFAAL